MTPALAPWGKHRIDRGLPYTVVAFAGANYRERCYLAVTDAELADREGPRVYRFIDAATGHAFEVHPPTAMLVHADDAHRYREDLESFAEEAFTTAGWKPEPCPDRLCPVMTAHHHTRPGRVVPLDSWPWDHPKAHPLDDVRRTIAELEYGRLNVIDPTAMVRITGV